MAAQLLRAGANVKAANRYGVTPLSLACTNGNGALVELLLKAGADPNLALPGGETPLMTAARTGALASVKALVSRGASVDAKDESRGQTALMWAAAEGHAAVVQELDRGRRGCPRACALGLHAAALCREGRPSRRRSRAAQSRGRRERDHPSRRAAPARLWRAGCRAAGASALLLAVMNAHFELAAALLDAGANPNADLTGYTRASRDHRGPPAGRRRQRSGSRWLRNDEQPRAREEARGAAARTSTRR